MHRLNEHGPRCKRWAWGGRKMCRLFTALNSLQACKKLPESFCNIVSTRGIGATRSAPAQYLFDSGRSCRPYGRSYAPPCYPVSNPTAHTFSKAGQTLTRNGQNATPTTPLKFSLIQELFQTSFYMYTHLESPAHHCCMEVR